MELRGFVMMMLWQFCDTKLAETASRNVLVIPSDSYAKPIRG